PPPPPAGGGGGGAGGAGAGGGGGEPKWAQQKTARNGDSVTEHHTCSWHTAIHYLLTGKPGRQRRRR
ncbi:hypothetical protein HMPREF9542_05370, partial [Escherichia coli MS 117-3]